MAVKVYKDDEAEDIKEEIKEEEEVTVVQSSEPVIHSNKKYVTLGKSLGKYFSPSIILFLPLNY